MRWPLLGLVAGLAMLDCVPGYDYGNERPSDAGGTDTGGSADTGSDGGATCGVLTVDGGAARAPSQPFLNPTSITAEGWFYPTAFPTQFQGLISHWGDVGQGTGSWGLFLDNGRPSFSVSCNGDEYNTVLAQQAIQLNRWTHVAGIFDTATKMLYVYVDGARWQYGPIACAKPHAANNPLTVSFDTQDRFIGSIDEVRISSDVRYTTETITPAATFTKDATTLALYHYDTIGQTTAIDSSDNANHGTLIGGAEMTSRCR
jgi:hypothetical protein